jgi:toxin ParE1/3/4
MTAVRAVVWAPRAKQGFARYLAIHVRVASPEIADRIVREIASSAERLGQNPLPERDRDELRPSLRSLLVHPHTLFYRIEANTAQVVRVLHERRDFLTLFAADEE